MIRVVSGTEDPPGIFPLVQPGTGPSAANALSGTAHGPVVQAGSIGQIHFHRGPERGVPRQLAPAPAHFTNRDAELDELDRPVAHPDRCGLVVLSGFGGVGKTALALSWLHRARDRFADGQLYADLSGADAGRPADPATVLGDFLRALGVPPEELPAGTGPRAAWFRSSVAGRSVAILLDNAWTAAQVRALLPAAPSCTVVVTTRRMLRSLLADGARFIDVGPLNADASRTLLLKAVGRQRISAEPEPARELVRLCGGLPIALSVTAARLASRRLLRLGETVAELQQEQRRLGLLSRGEEVSVRSVFDASYQELPGPARSTYRAMGLHPGPEFDRAVLAAATGLGRAALDEPLEALQEAHLLQEVRGGRYRFHDLIRLHAKEKADVTDTAERRAEVLLRIVEHYVRRTGQAAALCTPHLRGAAYEFAFPEADSAEFADRGQALDWLEQERANLVGAVRAAADGGLLAAAWQLGYLLWPLFRYRGHHADWRAVDEACLAAARELGEPELEARTARRLAMLHHRHAEWAVADRLLHRCAELHARSGDAYGAADTADAQAVLALARGDALAARASAQHAETGFAITGFPRKAALARLLSGQAGVRIGEVATGLTEVRAATALLREHRAQDPFNAARARLVLGESLVAAGEVAEAAAEIDAGATEMDELDSPVGQALAHSARAELAAARGHPADERRQLAAALRLFEHQGDEAAAAPLRDRLTGPSGPA